MLAVMLGLAWAPGTPDKKNAAKYKKALSGIHLPSDGDLDAVQKSVPGAKEAIAWMKNKDNWVEILSTLEDKLGVFFEDLNVQIKVSPANKGGWSGMGGGFKGKGSLEVYVGGQGKGLDAFKRNIAHEMSHVYLGSGFGPAWVVEGLGKFVENSPDGIMYFILTKSDPQEIGVPLARYEANYGRGYLFFTYLTEQHGPQALKDFVKYRLEETKVQEALEKATKLKWADLTKKELEWTKANWKKIAKKHGMPVR